MPTIKVKSVSEFRRNEALKSNKYIRKWGEGIWMAALLTAYQNGGYDDLKRNTEIPMKWLGLLLDAYRYKSTEEEMMFARASGVPYMKKADSKKYWQELSDKLEGKT